MRIVVQEKEGCYNWSLCDVTLPLLLDTITVRERRRIGRK
jgi:hypothetical protein